MSLHKPEQTLQDEGMGTRTYYSNEFRAAFAAYYHPLFAGCGVFDHCGEGVEELHLSDHDVADVPSVISFVLMSGYLALTCGILRPLRDTGIGDRK